MNQQQQVGEPFHPPGIPLKRKRGRPRKDRSQYPSSSSYVPRTKDQSQPRAENASVPPGFVRANGNQSHSVDTTNENNEDSMVGQVVTGVIEAAFEAGYLLSVRVGDSETSLRGVVFKPGHYVPVSAENDVAPSLQMIRRNEIPFPSGNQGHKRRGRKRKEHHSPHQSNGSPPSNQFAEVRAKQMSVVAVQSLHPVGARGTVVPVVLEPVNLSNGAAPAVEAPPIALQPAHLAASRSKPPPVTQAAQEAMPKKSSEGDSGSGSQPFEELVSAAKRMQGSPDSHEAQNASDTSSGKMLPKDSAVTQAQVEDLSKPLTVKPLQAIRSGFPDPSAPMPHTFPERRTGKMTELLLAVQENLRETHMAETQHPDFQSPQN